MSQIIGHDLFLFFIFLGFAAAFVFIFIVTVIVILFLIYYGFFHTKIWQVDNEYCLLCHSCD